MCLGIPGKVVEIRDDGPLRMARFDFGGDGSGFSVVVGDAEILEPLGDRDAAGLNADQGQPAGSGVGCVALDNFVSHPAKRPGNRRGIQGEEGVGGDGAHEAGLGDLAGSH